MDNTKNDAYYIDKIIDDLKFIIRHMEDVNEEDLGENEVLLDSMMFRLIQISENAKSLSEEYKDNISDIPWSDIYGLRNRIVHDYGNVDLGIIFSTLKDDIPELLLLINESLRK